MMKKGEKSSVVGSAAKENAVAKEKESDLSLYQSGMDFDPKKSKLLNQEEVDKYLVKYGFRLNLGIKIEFCLNDVDISKAPPNDGVYIHPQALALGLKLLMMRFVHSVLTFYRVAPSQLSTVA